MLNTVNWIMKSVLLWFKAVKECRSIKSTPPQAPLSGGLSRRWSGQTVVIHLTVGIIVFGVRVALANGSTLITFDDLTPRSSDKIPYPYHGLVFSGDPYNGIYKSDGSPIPGLRNGAVSAPNVLLSAGQSNSIQAYRPEERAVFTLYSGYFTSAYDSVLTVEARGFTPDDILGPTFSKTFSINDAGPTLITFDWTGITEVELTGGYAPGSPNKYVLDNLRVDTASPEVVPEPSATALMCVGLLILYLRISSTRLSPDQKPDMACIRPF